VTPQYLARLFRRFLGCSPYEYLTNYRINRARELLVSNPRLEVQQIARQTGFSDTSHFIAMFKKATGVTPLEFRRLN
jgi:AraC-like DNA-binding protein